MDLLQNPFHILTVSPRDNRQQIMLQADERSLLLDSSEVMEARSDLTNPRKRLSAEIAWLPGVGPKRSREFVSLLESSPISLHAIDKISSIARTNLLAAGLLRLTDPTADDVAKWILEISWSFENINTEELAMIINEERVASGFPEISDLSVVEENINERRRYYSKVIKSALDNLSSKKLVEAVTVAVDSSTDNGNEHGPILISDLVDLYEVEAQVFLEKEETNIKSLVNRLRNAIDEEQTESVLTPMVNQLIQVVKNWDLVAQPIQVSTMSRGLTHEASHRVAGMIRDLAIYMFNEHGMLEFSKQLTNMLCEVFAEVSQVAERTAEDASDLEAVAEQRDRLLEDAKNSTEEWRHEITYEADIGIMFKDKLRISPDGIEWKGRRWELDTITRIRWGGAKHSVNGIPTGTTYNIFFGYGINHVNIELRKEAIYNNFIDRLWKAVGIRLLMEYLEGLRDGKQYRIGSTIMSDQGMEFERKKFFGSNELVFCHWNELIIWNGNGSFCIGKKQDKKLVGCFSYLHEDNIRVIEIAIRMFWKQGGDTLSSLLEG